MSEHLHWLDRLDEFWQTGKGPRLEELLVMARGQNAPADILVDMCAADLEWRWRVKSIRTAGPNAADYSAQLQELWTDVSSRRVLLEAEWLARNRFGDQPDADIFAQLLPNESAWSQRLVDQLDLIMPLQLRVCDPFRMRLICRLPSELTLGRARSDEPSAPALIAGKRRLVIADRTARGYSREQLRLRRKRLNEIEIHNLSTKIEIRMGDRNLAPQASMRLQTPIRLDFSEFSLTIVDEA